MIAAISPAHTFSVLTPQATTPQHPSPRPSSPPPRTPAPHPPTLSPATERLLTRPIDLRLRTAGKSVEKLVKGVQLLKKNVEVLAAENKDLKRKVQELSNCPGVTPEIMAFLQDGKTIAPRCANGLPDGTKRRRPIEEGAAKISRLLLEVVTHKFHQDPASMLVVRKVENVPVGGANNRPKLECTIVECGEL